MSSSDYASPQAPPSRGGGWSSDGSPVAPSSSPPTFAAASASSASSSVLASFRGLDLHSKVSSDFAVRTKAGACVSLLTLLVSLVLFIAELRFYLGVEVVEHMEVDSLRGQRMRVNFDVTFPRLSCAAVSVDTQDASGTATHDVLHNVFKKRLDSQGLPLGDVEHTGDGTPGLKAAGAGTLTSAAALLKEKQKAIAEGRHSGPVAPVAGARSADSAAAAAAARAAAAPGTAACGSCYGAGAEGECCETCEQVREGYRRKGWQFNMKGIAPCEKEGFYGDVAAQQAAEEGCNLYGFLEVPKVPGNFHFAPGHAMQHAYGHVHDLVQFAFSSFNVSHRVNSLSFGAYLPGSEGGVLDGRSLTLEEGSGMHQYFVKLVPTLYQGLGQAEAHAYQFSVTEHLRKLDPRAAQLDAATGLLPGLFFNYELSPIRVRRQEKKRSLGHFLTEVCAIVGGVFTVGSLVDSLVGLASDVCGREARKRAAQGGGLIA